MNFLGMIICFTGRFDGFVKNPAEASTEALVLAGGGCCVGEVSKKVDYLVISGSALERG